MGTVPPRIIPPLRQWEQPLTEDVYATPVGRLRESIEENGITLEEAFDHVVKSNPWEYLGIQFTHWLSGGFTLRDVANALTMAFGKRDSRKPLPAVEDEPQEMLIEYEYGERP